MKWEIKDQIIFEMVDRGLNGLKKLGWITQSDYDNIQSTIGYAIRKRE